MVAERAFSDNRFAQRNIENVGTALQFIIPTFVFARTLYEPDNGDSTGQFVKHFLFSNGITYLIKFSVDEERPDGSALNSFPSGHTAAAFSGATFTHFRYSFDEAKYLYILSAFTAFSRVYARRHYTHDVLASVALSLISSYIFVTRRNSQTNYTLGLDPLSGKLHFGFSFSFR
jgi:membrane-associated phospholipid phosphatase